MLRLLLQKVLLLLLLLPILNAGAFYYALTFAPGDTIYIRGQPVERPAPPPFLPLYRTYVQRVLRGDFGEIQNFPVTQRIAQPLKNSLVLLVAALAVATVLGPLLGLISISPQTNRMRPAAQVLLTAGSAVPGFFLGSLLIAFVLYTARQAWFPGRGPLIPVQGFGLDSHLILPVLTLAVRPTVYVAHMTASLLENELQQGYMQVARSKGLRWRRLVWHHAFPNVISPLITIVGQSLRLMISGLILVEALFDWPGIGRLLTLVVTNPDVRAQGSSFRGYFLEPELLAMITVVLGILLLLADLLAAVLAYVADPRLRRTTHTNT